MRWSQIGWYALQIGVAGLFLWGFLLEAPNAISGLAGPHAATIAYGDTGMIVFAGIFAVGTTAAVSQIYDFFRYRVFGRWLPKRPAGQPGQWERRGRIGPTPGESGTAGGGQHILSGPRDRE